ncbi:hypothetical protein QFZ48_001473 [Chitinophaga sp. W2I13]|uniref:RagB/SusD family nutrient uptake outer membrane protein n=1 Tax=Chitinophaga sp. W2I13 TaxID=3373923 RepID=UPI003D24BD6A
MKRYMQYSILAIALFCIFTACKKDYQDPSGPSSEQAYSSPATLANAAVGLQAWYAKDRTGLLYTTVTSGSLLLGETFVTNPGNADEGQIAAGGNKILTTNVVVTGMWNVSNKIRYEADSILRRTGVVVADKGFASGLIGYTTIFKALALGVQANFWEQVPENTGTPVSSGGVKFVPAKQGYVMAVAALDNAISTITATPIGTSFLANIPQNVDIINTLYALKARYALYAGDYPAAISAADKVNLGVQSTLSFNPQINNPIFSLVTATNNIYNVVDSTMGLPVPIQPDLADQRVPFYIARPAKPKFNINGFFRSSLTAVPIYLPGEMLLIKAEAYARQHDIVNGLLYLNKVVTKKASEDAFGVGAALPPVVAVTEAELLTLIYKHRRIELFMGGPGTGGQPPVWKTSVGTEAELFSISVCRTE